MKLGLLNYNKKSAHGLKDALATKGILTSTSGNATNYEELGEQLSYLNKKSIDFLMLANMPEDFSFFLDYLNPKMLKKMTYNIIGNASTTAFLNFAFQNNKDIRIVYGPTFNTYKSIQQLEKYYDEFAIAMTSAIKTFELDNYEENSLLKFNFVKKVKGLMIGGDVKVLINMLGTDYFQIKTKGSVLFIDNLSNNEEILRQQLTALNQKKTFIGVKAVVFGIIPNFDLSSFIHHNFLELERLNLVFNFSGIQATKQSYVIIGKNTVIDPEKGVLYQTL